MTIRRLAPVLVLAATVLAASPRARADDKDETAERARLVLRTYCQKCHAGPADQNKGGLDIFDRKQLRARKVVRDDPDRSELFQLAACGSMPPGDLPKPTTEEVGVLRDWISGGAPEFPPEYGDGFVLRKIQKDLASLDSKAMPYQRYFSFNHLLADDPAGPDAPLWRDALLKALNHLSLRADPVAVTPIDPAKTIFRVDERRLGWDVQPFDAPDPADPKAAPRPSRVDFFDLILLEYPFATLPSRFAGDQKPLADYLRKANPVRPILYVRGDWFVSTATQSPLYEDLLRLPRVLNGADGLEGRIGAGPDAARAAYLDAQKRPQLVERRPSAAAGAYWRTFDPGPAKDVPALQAASAAPDFGDRGGLMLFGLPNGLNGYYIAENVPDDGGKRLVRLAAAAPKAWQTDPNAADQVARNGLSCMRCHETGVAPFADAAEATTPLFPGKAAIDKFLADDRAGFLKAALAVHGGPLDREPLTPVTRRFLLGSKPGPVVPALLDAAAAVATSPVAFIRDEGARAQALVPGRDLDAPPLPPLDGLTLPDWQPPLAPVKIVFKSLNFETKEETAVFHPGDQFALEVTNEGKDDVWIELIAAFMGGEKMQVDQAPLKLAAGKTYHYPKDRVVKPKDYLKMGLPPGVDRYILFAADAELPGGVPLHAAHEKNLGDRVIHPFWAVAENGSEAVSSFDLSHLIKKTLFIETKEK